MKIKLKPNELVVKASDIKLEDGKKNKLIITNQKRIYLLNNDNKTEINNIKEINYFNSNFFNRNGVIIITNDNKYKFYIKKRNKWEKVFSSLY